MTLGNGYGHAQNGFPHLVYITHSDVALFGVAGGLRGNLVVLSECVSTVGVELQQGIGFHVHFIQLILNCLLLFFLNVLFF